MGEHDNYDQDQQSDSRWLKRIAILCLLAGGIIYGVQHFQLPEIDWSKYKIIYSKDGDVDESELIEDAVEEDVIEENIAESKPTKAKAQKQGLSHEAIPALEKPQEIEQKAETAEAALEVSPEITSEAPKVAQPTAPSEKSTLEILEERNHANAVKRAQEVGVSTEGSTLDILERINHANTVKRAQEVGVSTEGSTLDILERINHVNTVKRAQELGVSTEGSTLDILERINHANTVKRAQELGVSTEGSTLDILERITKKQMENYR